MLLSVALLAVVIAGCKRRGITYPANYREYVYVTNGGSNDVSVIDLPHLRKVQQIAVGTDPSGIAANPHTNELYVVNTGSGTVSVIDAQTNAVTATIAVGKTPYEIDVASDGTRAVVANSGDDTVSLIDLKARKVTATFHVGHAPGLARMALKAPVAVVTERESDSISVIDLAAVQVRTGSLPVCKTPTDIVILPDGSKAFVACSGAAQVAVVGLEVPAEASSGASSVAAVNSKRRSEDKLLTLLHVGDTPVHLAMKPDTGEIFVENFDGSSISEIATGSNEVGGTYFVGSKPSDAVITADNSLLYVSNFGSDDVAQYSIDNGKVIATVAVGGSPDALALSRDEQFLFVADTKSEDLAVIRTNVGKGKPTILTLLPLGKQPNAIAVKAFTIGPSNQD